MTYRGSTSSTQCATLAVPLELKCARSISSGQPSGTAQKEDNPHGTMGASHICAGAQSVNHAWGQAYPALRIGPPVSGYLPGLTRRITRRLPNDTLGAGLSVLAVECPRLTTSANRDSGPRGPARVDCCFRAAHLTLQARLLVPRAASLPGNCGKGPGRRLF